MTRRERFILTFGTGALTLVWVLRLLAEHLGGWLSVIAWAVFGLVEVVALIILLAHMVDIIQRWQKPSN